MQGDWLIPGLPAFFLQNGLNRPNQVTKEIETIK
jgi:hypothetical protein